MKHITIVTRNRVGALADVATVLANKNINIESIEAINIRGWAIIRLIVDQYDIALHAFGGTEFLALAENTLLVQIEDKPGSLATIAQRLKDHQIDIHSVRIVGRDANTSLVAITAAKHKEAQKLLSDVLLSAV